MATGAVLVLTPTPTRTPTLTVTPIPPPPVPFTPVIPAIVIVACLLLAALGIAWVALRRRPRGPSWAGGLPKTMTGSRRALPGDAPGAPPPALNPASDGEKPPTSLPPTLVPKAVGRLQSYAPDNESAHSSSDTPGVALEARPLIPYYIPDNLEALYALPAVDSRSSSQPTSARSGRSGPSAPGRSPRSFSGTTSQDRLLAAPRPPPPSTLPLEPIEVATAPGVVRSSRLRIVSDAATPGVVWTGPLLTPQHGTWSILNETDAAVDRHLDGMVASEVSAMTGPGLAVVGPDPEDPGPRARRRRRSSTDSERTDPLSDFPYRRSRFLSPARGEAPAALDARGGERGDGGDEVLMQSVRSGARELSSDSGDV